MFTYTFTCFLSGILQAFQFLENVLLSNHPELSKSSTSQALVPPPLVTDPDKIHFPDSNDDHHLNKRQTEDETDEGDEDYSMEEMKMMHDYDVDETDHEMSVVDDHGNSTKKDWHINLFGEIVHNSPDTGKFKLVPIDFYRFLSIMFEK